MKTPPTPKHSVPRWRGAGSQLQSNSKTQNHFPLHCKEIKDRLNVLYESWGPAAPRRSLQPAGEGDRRRRGDDDRGQERRGGEERRERRLRRGRADGGVICVGCGRWGKHGCVSVLSDASRSVRNQFRAGRQRRAYNN